MLLRPFHDLGTLGTPGTLGNNMFRGFWIAFVSMAIIMLLPMAHSPADAASCSRLKSQLASLSRGGNNRYSRAASKQQKQIKLIDARIRRQGCGFGSGFFNLGANRTCKSLKSRRAKMVANLRKLQRVARNGGSNPRLRRKLEREFKRRGCGNKSKLKVASIAQQIFGLSTREKKRQRNRDRRKQRQDQAIGTRVKLTEQTLANHNTLRTMCVRTCDGYYFPVSFSIRKSRLATDAQACNNLCPGQEMKLYYHKTSGETALDLVSAENGEPYTSLPNAYAHQSSYKKSCSCQYDLLKPARKEVEKTYSRAEIRKREWEAIAKLARPVWRAPLGDDPESVINMRGGLNYEQLPQLIRHQPGEKLASNRRIRIVGEPYLPAQ